MKAIDRLDPASKTQLAGDLEKSINTPPAAETPPGAETPPTPGAETPPTPGAVPDELDTVKKNAGLPTGTPPAKPAPGAGAFSQMSAQLGGQKPNTMANAPVSKTNVAKPGNPNAAAPAATPPLNGPKINGLQVRNMGEGKKLKFRSNFLGIDL